MSPLWRDQLGVVLHPDHLVLVRVKTGLRRPLQHTEVVPTQAAEEGTPAWMPVVNALKPLAASDVLNGANVTLVLSSAFVRYVLVPRCDALNTEQEQLAFARHRFASIHGKETEEWIIRLAPASARQARLACAIERPLVEALDEAMGPLGARYESLQPHLVTSFNCWRREIGKRPLWFVVVESGMMSVALLRDGEFASLRTMRAGAGWPDELPGILGREKLLNDVPEGPSEVLVFGEPDQPPLNVPSKHWTIRSLRPNGVSTEAAARDAVPEGSAPNEAAATGTPLFDAAAKKRGGRREIRLDLRRQWRPSVWPGVAVLAIACAGALVVGAQFHHAAADLASLESQLQADRDVVHGRAKDHVRRDVPETLEDKRVAEIAAQLRLPWNDLFHSIESSPVRGVGLLSIESGNDDRKVKISALAKNETVMLAYLAFVADLPALKSVYLESHAVQEQDPLQVIRFVVAGEWVVTGPAPAKGTL